MKRLICLLLAAVLLIGTLTACSFVEQSVGSFVMSGFDYHGNAYSRAHDWFVDSENTDYRTDTVTVDGVDYDIRVYGENDDFIYMVISGDEYHNDSLPFPTNTPDSVEAVELLYDETTVSSSDAQIIQNFCDLFADDNYTTDALTGARYLCTCYVRYQDCPAECAIGAALGVEDRYYFRCDCADGADIGDQPRYYPISADFFFS